MVNAVTENISACSEKHMKPMITLLGQYTTFLNVKSDGSYSNNETGMKKEIGL
jgi:hypothetical protein